MLRETNSGEDINLKGQEVTGQVRGSAGGLCPTDARVCSSAASEKLYATFRCVIISLHCVQICLIFNGDNKHNKYFYVFQNESQCFISNQIREIRIMYKNYAQIL